MSELKYWLWLSSLTGVRPRVKRLLIERYGGVREVYFAPRGDYAALGGLTEQECAALENKSFDTAYRIIEDCENLGVDIRTIQDADYPRRLAAIYDPPVVLYVRGRLPVVDEKAAVAVVGTRRASPYGIKMAARLGYELTRCGGLVVSGLTVGVDVTAAQGALMAGGSCIGVLGSPIDDESWGGETTRDVAAAGAVISEYPPGAKRHPAFFRARNRITAGLCVAAVVVEAPKRSGALLFADEALSQGKEVFAVPANADAENALFYPAVALSSFVAFSFGDYENPLEIFQAQWMFTALAVTLLSCALFHRLLGWRMKRTKMYTPGADYTFNLVLRAILPAAAVVFLAAGLNVGVTALLGNVHVQNWGAQLFMKEPGYEMFR